MTSSLGCAEVPQAVLLTICSWSPVSHVISVHITKTLYVSLQFIPSYLRVFFFFPPAALLFLDFFFPKPQLLFVFLLIFTRSLCFPNVTVSLDFLWFSRCHSSSLTLISPSQHFFFFFSISICHVCASVPVLFLRGTRRGSHIQRLQSFPLHRRFCCSQAVSCCAVMFGAKVPLKWSGASSERQKKIYVYIWGVTVLLWTFQAS